MTVTTTRPRVTGPVRRWAAALAVSAALAVLAPVGAASPAAALDVPDQDHTWVAAVYRDLLERPPTAAQRDHRVAQLQAGRSRRSIADELVASREHAGILVDRAYRRILGRAVDATSRTYWVDRLVGGERPTTVASFLYGSPELYAEAGGTAPAYVTFLYRDVLGREPDAGGLAYWSGRVAAGENRTGLARSWLLTAEASGLRAVLVFVDLLRRPPSPAEQADWGGRLRRLDDRRVAAALVSTTEYGNGTQNPSPSTELTRGDDDSADPAISGDGRIVAFASTASDLTPAGSPPGRDIFTFDRRTGRTRAITAGNGTSSAPHVSADGTTVVFQSAATNLVAGDTNGRIDVFRASTTGGPVERIAAGDGHSTEPKVSGDGSTVVFTSVASNLVAEADDGGRADVFVHTDGSPTTLERVSADDGGAAIAPDVSADGGTLVFQGEGVVDDVPPQVHLVALPLGPDPDVVQLSVDEGDTPTVTTDGDRVAYVETTPGEGDDSGPWIHIVDLDGGTVVDRDVRAAAVSEPRPRLADGGEAYLALRMFNAGSAVFSLDALWRLDGTVSGAIGFDSDLSADGRLVVAPLPLFAGRVTQITLLEP